MTFLPRQARDKHRESKTHKKRVAVFAGRPTFLYSFDHTPYESVNEGRISSHLGADFEFSLWLSRACLGKMTVYIYKWPCLVPPRCGKNSKRACDPFSLKSSREMAIILPRQARDNRITKVRNRRSASFLPSFPAFFSHAFYRGFSRCGGAVCL